jgi:hypothetical protein
MTVKFPEPNIFDKFLRSIGRKRGVIIPTKVYEKYGQHAYVVFQRESLWKALIRSKNKKLPEGTVDIFSFQSELSNFK